MKFDVGVPSGAIKHFETWVGEGKLNEFAVAAEEAGLDAVNVTEHPFPEDSWLANGGHHAFDPFVALSSMSAVTSTIGLRTNLLVAGYRNPYLAARSIASLDVLSGGRVIVGMGAGYLRAEFEVLGADFATGGSVRRGHRGHDGRLAWHIGGSRRHLLPGPRPFDGARARPAAPSPHLGGRQLQGGDAPRRPPGRRVAALPQPEVMAAITGSPALTSVDDLRAGIDEVHRLRSEAGLGGSFDVAFASFDRPDPEGDPSGERFRDRLAVYEEAGVTWLTLGCHGRTLAACQEELAWLSESVVGPYRRATTA